MGIFRYDSPLMMVLLKITNCIFLSMLWLICCAPVITAGASTAALYHTVQKVIRDERGYIGTEFFQSFRGSLRQTVTVTAAGLVIVAVFLSDYWILEAAAQAGYTYGHCYVLFQILLVAEVLYLVYVMIYIARFQTDMKTVLKNCSILAVARPGSTLLVGLILLIGSAMIYLMPLTILILPTVMAWLISVPIEKLFERN